MGFTQSGKFPCSIGIRLRVGATHPPNFMKINPRYYPAIILVTFAVFMLIGFFIFGFRPQHGNGRGNESLLPLAQYILVALKALA